MRVPRPPRPSSSTTSPSRSRAIAAGARVASRAVLALAATWSLACATGGRPAAAPAPTTSDAGREVLTAEELRRYPDPTASLLDRVRVLRAGFARSRGAEPVVLIGGRYAGPLSVLNEIPVRSVQEIRLVRGVEVPLVYGHRQRHAVVLDVILRR